MELNFNSLRLEIIECLDKVKHMVCATSSDDLVTARMVSTVNDGLTIYFQTDKTFLKYRQIEANPNVALCIDNIQIEGHSTIEGHPFDEKNMEFLQLFKPKQENAFKTYSHLKNEVVIKIEPNKFTLWKYIDKKPCRDFLLIDTNMAYREYYLIK